MRATVYIPNTVDKNSDHYKAVKAVMAERGECEIRVFNAGDCYIALEGSHRLNAALELKIMPELVEMTEREWIEHDFEDIRKSRCSVARVLEHLHMDINLIFDENEMLEN